MEELFDQGLLGGFFAALAGLAFYPITGGTFWTAGGAAAGVIVGLGSDRRAGFTGVVFGMWASGVAGGLANSDTYGSAVAGVLVWAAVGAPVGALAGHLLGPRLGGVPRGAARGLFAGMLFMAAGGVWLLLEVAGENRPALLGGWVAVPVLTGLAGAALGCRCLVACRNHKSVSAGSDCPAEGVHT